MNKEIIINEAISIEAQIRRLIEGFGEAPDKISQIDVDLALGKIRKLYDILLQPKITTVVEDKPEEEVVIEIEEPEPVNEDQNIQAEIEQPAESEEKPIQQTKVDDPAPEVLFETKDQPEGKLKESVSTGVTMDLFGETVADTLTNGSTKTLADTISENIEKESVADVIHKTSIDNIKTSIGINEKFFFINELFDGNMKDYNEAIEKLNVFTGKDEAIAYFNGLKDKYQWKEENEAFGQLKELVGRRYYD